MTNQNPSQKVHSQCSYSCTDTQNCSIPSEIQYVLCLVTYLIWQTFHLGDSGLTSQLKSQPCVFPIILVSRMETSKLQLLSAMVIERNHIGRTTKGFNDNCWDFKKHQKKPKTLKEILRVFSCLKKSKGKEHLQVSFQFLLAGGLFQSILI
ncbi:UNVERIFIED_CONTAM: hypothetical protein K2H54_059523 [Gekko kuhli]